MIRIGIAGWDYPDWTGIVYPRGAARGFDELAWIARFVDLAAYPELAAMTAPAPGRLF